MSCSSRLRRHAQKDVGANTTAPNFLVLYWSSSPTFVLFPFACRTHFTPRRFEPSCMLPSTSISFHIKAEMRRASVSTPTSESQLHISIFAEISRSLSDSYNSEKKSKHLAIKYLILFLVPRLISTSPEMIVLRTRTDRDFSTNKASITPRALSSISLIYRLPGRKPARHRLKTSSTTRYV